MNSTENTLGNNYKLLITNCFQLTDRSYLFIYYLLLIHTSDALGKIQRDT